MSHEQIDLVLKRFERPDGTREMAKGRFEIVRIGALTIGRATYEPGWKWSEHVGPALGQLLCPVEHVGLVLSGAAAVAFEDGTVHALTPGTLFHVPPLPHDSWVVGDEPYVSLHLSGAEHYATQANAPRPTSTSPRFPPRPPTPPHPAPESVLRTPSP